MRAIKTFISVLGLITTLPAFSSVDFSKENTWIVSPFADYFHFDSKRDLKDGKGPGIAAGYYLYENIEIQASLASFSTKLTNSTQKKSVNGEYITAGGSYYLNNNNKLQPFFALDVGTAHFNHNKHGNAETQALLDAGVGSVYFLNKQILIFVEGLAYHTITGLGDADFSCQGGLSVLLGKNVDNEEEERPSRMPDDD